MDAERRAKILFDLKLSAWIVLGLLVAAPVDVPDEIARRFPGAAIPSGRAG
jgi:hypothetical protein